jgi:putative PEP-CTERM system histidine kinase
VAASLRNIDLSRQLVQAKELEAFQAMSAFVVHDLKNTASTLSLTVQNMGTHFDKPEFRQDAIRGLGKSVAHITDLIGRLNLLRQKLEIRPVEVDLNDFLTAKLAELDSVLSLPVKKDLQPVPKLLLDPEQFSKVLTNLLFNARDAVEGRGEVTLCTAAARGWVCLTVADNGCGMNPEFLRASLFKPFQTTKKKGLGIGMFHSKMIVEAHRGRIEVQSEPGKGTAFKILLPLPESKP